MDSFSSQQVMAIIRPRISTLTAHQDTLYEYHTLVLKTGGAQTTILEAAAAAAQT